MVNYPTRLNVETWAVCVAPKQPSNENPPRVLYAADYSKPLKNLATYTIKYYEESVNFFQNFNRWIKNVDEITQEVIDGYGKSK